MSGPRAIGALLFALVLCTGCGGGEEARIRAVEEGLLPAVIREEDRPPRRTIDDRMLRYAVPGAAVAVIDGGRIDWAKGYGVLERGGADRPDGASLFPVSSVTMPVVASVALRLASEGRLDPDRDVNATLRGWRVPGTEAFGGEPVTVRRILRHRAGLNVPGFEGFRPDERLPGTIEILEGRDPARNEPVRVVAKPGSAFRWSAGGYALLGLLLEEAAGAPLDSWMKEYLFQPLGMNRTQFNSSGGPAGDLPLASHHRIDGSPAKEYVRIYPALSAQGLWSTAEELALWILALQEAYAGRSDRLLPPERAREMLEPGPDGWGLGVRIGGEGESAWFAQDDGGFGCGARIVGFLQGGRGAVILTNGERGGRLAGEILRSVAEAYRWPAFRAVRVREGAVDPSVLPRLAGAYRVEDLPGLEEAEILVEEEGPAIRMLGVVVPLAAESSRSYFSLDAEVLCRFDLPEENDGPAAGFTLHWRGAEARAIRMEGGGGAE